MAAPHSSGNSSGSTPRPSSSQETLTKGISGIYLDDAQPDEDNNESYNLASYLGQSFLRPDHKSSLLEILRCAVCLEVPKNKPNLQIKCCEVGHHFCTFCHEKLKSCAVCRGSLEKGRNFVVEEIIMKLGREFGFANSINFDLAHPPLWPKGFFKCPHCNSGNFPSVKMLQHMRVNHAEALKDKLRTNPHTKWFQYNLIYKYQPGKRYVFSFHVSELGVITFGVLFPEQNSNQPIRAWIQALNKSNFLYQILFSTESKQFFGVSDQPVLDYKEAEDVNKMVAFSTNYAFTIDENLEFNLIIHAPGLTKPDTAQKSVLWKVPTMFQSDRRSRRTIARNKRRALLRASHRGPGSNYVFAAPLLD